MSSRHALQRHLTTRVVSLPCLTCFALESCWRRLWTHVQLPILFKLIISYTSFWVKSWQQLQPWCVYRVSGVHSGSRSLAKVRKSINALQILNFQGSSFVANCSTWYTLCLLLRSNCTAGCITQCFTWDALMSYCKSLLSQPIPSWCVSVLRT